MKFVLRLLALVLASLGGSAPAQAKFTVYTDRAAWEAAAGSFAQERFDGATPDGFSLVEVGPGHSFGVGGGAYDDRVVGDSSFTVYAFGNPITAFGADWDLSLDGPGQGLRLQAGGFDIGSELANTSNGFFGFTADFAFDALTVLGGTQGGVAETHRVDNVVYGITAPVPEPATYAMMLGGLLVLSGMARRRVR